jgi:hypothetical protein
METSIFFFFILLFALGSLVIVDHEAPKGSGSQFSGSNRGLHRVESVLVKEEAEKWSDFVLVEELDLYRDATERLDTLAWSDPFHYTNRFVLVFKKKK